MTTNSHRNALPSGYRLHWYVFDRVLGQGGFGVTYLARDENLQQAVAIKEFLPSEIAVRGESQTVQPRSGGDTEQFQQGVTRFLAEARTLAQFVHPNITQVMSVFEANNTAYMVMRYEQGESLRAILKQRRFLPEEELLMVVLPILEGLAKVHGAGFIHRDIQPPNIYVRDDGTPVLLDFGSARHTLGGPRTLTILVAPGYAPIEQYYSSSAEQGPWTDIYAMGATMYRAVAGVAPIDAIERSRGMLGSTRDLLVPAKLVGQGRYSECFLNSIDHALMFSEKNRPRSIAEWLPELKGATVAATGPAVVPAQLKSAPKPPAMRTERAASGLDTEAATQVSQPHGARMPTLLRLAIVGVIFGLGVGIGLRFMNVMEDSGPVEALVASGTEMQAAASGAPRQQLLSETIEFDPSVALDPLPLETPAKEDAESGGSVPGDLLASPSADEMESAGPGIAVETPQASPAPAAPVAGDVRGAPAEVRDTAIPDQSSRVATLEQELQSLRRQRAAEEESARKLQAVTRQPAPAAPKTPAQAPPETTPSAPPAVTPLESALKFLSAGDYASALRELQPLAEGGNATAQFHVASLYRSGRGVLANNAIALDWMRKAATQGERNAQLALARMYFEGVDGVRDYFLAYTWFQVAEWNGAHEVAAFRREAEKELQPEQLVQASALATALAKQGGH